MHALRVYIQPRLDSPNLPRDEPSCTEQKGETDDTADDEDGDLRGGGTPVMLGEGDWRMGGGEGRG